MTQHPPVIYVRGFAGTNALVDDVVADPFYGFNAGSTHVRVGSDGEPAFHQFESPLLRLMTDHDYQLHVNGGQQQWLHQQRAGTVTSQSIWVHRFYDTATRTFGREREVFHLETAAADLLAFVDLVRDRTGAPRVHLVAHSMGGLVCRSLIQKIIPDRAAELGTGERAADVVDRLFTYATPHGGISFDVGGGLLERFRDATGLLGSDVFGPDRMWQYLTPGTPGRRPRDWDPRVLPADAFPAERVFTLVGTNPDDFDVARGLSSRLAGAKSDGLVRVERAVVVGAHQAHVHRSHSGRFGIVNSEEGYQNLRRFLLGDLEVGVQLVGAELPRGADPDDSSCWQADVELAVRGLPVLLHQQVAAHHCPVVLQRSSDGGDHPVPLVTAFLFTGPEQRPEGSRTSRYSLRLKMFRLVERGGLFTFRNHLEQTADVEEVLLVDVDATRDGDVVAWASWVSEIGTPLREHRPAGDPLTDTDPATGTWVALVPLPAAARGVVGQHAAVRLTVTGRGRSAPVAAAVDPQPV